MTRAAVNIMISGARAWGGVGPTRAYPMMIIIMNSTNTHQT